MAQWRDLFQVRRTKAQVGDIPELKLPELTKEYRTVELSEDEIKKYEALLKESQVTFEQFKSADGKEKRMMYTYVLTILARLQQVPIDYRLLWGKKALESFSKSVAKKRKRSVSHWFPFCFP
jgi:SNF2 family DNA or RNA helicase